MKRICENPSSTCTGRKRVHLHRNVIVVFLILVVSCLRATAVPAHSEPTPADNTGSAATKIEEVAENTNSTDKSSGAAPNTITLKLERCRPSSDETRAPIISAKPGKSPKITDVRLPKSLKPVKYLIRLQPFINGNFSIAGYTEITFEALEATQNVTLHIADIITKNDTIRLRPIDDLTGKGIEITEHRYDKDREFYIAILGQDLVAGKQYVLTMQFEAYLNDNLVGFYRSKYKDPQGSTRWLAATQFQTTYARRAFPCFDEPALKAEFEVFLARQTNMSAISNMPRIESTPIDGQPGWVWDHFNTSVPMSTYLVAFAVSDFTFINSTSTNGVLFRVWAREQAIDQAEYSNRIGPDILTYFEKYFDLPYPLPKQDMIALPDFSEVAMGNWGLITYRESSLLHDPSVSSTGSKHWVAVVIAHELAHQWFGDIVTPTWWTDLWLNVGFASYLENLGVDAVHPTWKMIEQFVVSDLQSVFKLDCLESSHPISIPVGHPDEIEQIFDGISYDKGSSIIRMMNHFLSESTLRKGLTNYLKHFEYDSAEQDDLWRFLTEQAHRDGSLPSNLTVKTIMDTWTLQMGYPVITVAFNGNGTASFFQERFLMTKNPNSTDKHEYKWWVPISFTTQDNPDFNSTLPSVWMASSESTKTISGLPSPDKWTIFNTQQTGFYRVNYDINNWKLIIKQLKSDYKNIGVINRAQVADDALNLARAGVLGYDVALDVISYLSKEIEYVPWKATLSNLGYLKNILTRTAAYGPFKRYLLSLLVPLYNSVGFTDNINDPHLDKLKRVEAVYWACSLDHKDCVKNSVQLFKKWMENPSNKSIISPDLKETVCCTAIREGGEKEWNFAWQQYRESNVAGEKRNLLRSLGCTKETWLLSKYMDIAFTADSGVRKQDASAVFAAVAGNEVGRDQAWNFLRARLPDIVEYYGSSGLSHVRSLVHSATAKFTTSFMKKELIRFSDENYDSLSSARRTVEQSIERTANNEAWLSAHYPVIVKWLRDNGYDNTI